MVTVLQGDKDIAIGGADHTGIAVGQIDAAVREAQRIDDAVQLRLRYGPADHVLDTVGQSRRFLDAQPALGTEVQLDLATVNVREKITPEPRHQQGDREGTAGEKQHGKQAAMFFGRFQRIAVTVPNALETLLETGLEAPQ